MSVPDMQRLCSADPHPVSNCTHQYAHIYSLHKLDPNDNFMMYSFGQASSLFF